MTPEQIVIVSGYITDSFFLIAYMIMGSCSKYSIIRYTAAALCVLQFIRIKGLHI